MASFYKFFENWSFLQGPFRMSFELLYIFLLVTHFRMKLTKVEKKYNLPICDFHVVEAYLLII